MSSQIGGGRGSNLVDEWHQIIGESCDGMDITSTAMSVGDGVQECHLLLELFEGSIQDLGRRSVLSRRDRTINVRVHELRSSLKNFGADVGGQMVDALGRLDGDEGALLKSCLRLAEPTKKPGSETWRSTISR